jgi:UrcA family protein
MTKLLSILLLAAALPTAALAEAPSTVSSIVRTADLDLSSESGRHALDVRLNRAISEVCGTASNADLSGGNEVRRCRTELESRIKDDREQRIALASDAPIIVAAR